MKLKYTSNIIISRSKWPVNLWVDILEITDFSINPPKDLAKSFDYIFKNLISEKDAKVLSYYYKEGLSLNEIAKMNTDIGNISRAVRTAKNKAIMHCKNDTIYNIVYHGLSKFLSNPTNAQYIEVDSLDISEEAYELLINNSINIVRDIIDKGKKKLMKIDGMTLEYISEIDSSLNEYHISFLPLKARNISYLNLPNKVYNLLYRNNIHTIGQLLKYTENDLRRINLVGDTIIRYIKTGLSEIGLKLTE